MVLSGFPHGDNDFHQDQYNKYKLKYQTNFFQTGEHCLTHSYDVSDRKSPYLAECFDIDLCDLLALEQPHKHHKDNRGTTYQVKVDVPIAHNEQNGKLDCNIIIAVLEEWQLD